MSELINNREMRKETLKHIIKQLHQGKSVDEVKDEFQKTFDGVSATEISEAEAALVAEGLPVEEIQNLCDVHASVFKGTIEEIHATQKPSIPKGHPLDVMVRENRELEKIIQTKVRPNLKLIENPDNFNLTKKGVDLLSKIDLHYSRKENLLFPYLEKYGVTAPPKVMWGVDDEIRMQIKELQKKLTAFDIKQLPDIKEKTEAIIERVNEMIFKEENILFPMLQEQLTQDEWVVIAKESKEIGFIIDDLGE